MALRSVIDIAINSAAFNRFSAQFKQYQAALAGTNASWAQVSKNVTGTRQNFNQLVAASMAQQTQARMLAQAQAHTTTQLNRQQGSWLSMAKSSASVAVHVKDMTRSLLRWSAITGTISGLLGAGGLFGIERLAASASGQRRSAMGLGTTPGQSTAFDINYSRMVNPQSFLGGVADALTDVTKRIGLIGAGFSNKELEGKTTTQVGVELIDKLKAIADKTPESQLEQVRTAQHLDQFITLDELRALRRMSPQEVQQHRQGYNRDIKTVDLPPAVQRAWQALDIQLERAGAQIKATFITGLVPLTGPIEKLSGAFQRLVSALMDEATKGKWIETLAGGLNSLADTVGSKSFQTSVTDFVRDVGELAIAIGKAVKWIASFLPEERKPGDPPAVSVITGLPKEQPGPLPPEVTKPPGVYTPKGNETRNKEMDDAEKTLLENLNRALIPFGNWLKTLGNNTGIGPSGGWQITPTPSSFSGMPLGGGGVPRIWNASYTPGQGGFGPFGPGMPNFGPSPGGFAPGTGGGGKFSRGTNAQITHDFFISQGWSEANVAGIMASAQGESGFDPHAVNKAGGDAGLFQWRGPRARQFAAMYGHRVQDGTLQEQLQFAQWELTHTEKRAGDRLRQISEAGASGDWVTRGFERPDPNRINIIAAERSALARRMQGQYSGGVQVIINNNTGGNAVVTTAALANQT